MQLGKLKLSNRKTEYNKQVLYFFIKLSILVTAWFIIYGLILSPKRIIDKPVTNILAVASAKCINALSPNTEKIYTAPYPNHAGSILVQNGEKVFGIMDVCNGVDLMFIYLCIIVLLPYPLKRKLIFSIGGIIAIIVANIIRITALYLIFKYRSDAFDFSHHYLFTLLMYVLIFYGWVLFIKKGMPNEKSG